MANNKFYFITGSIKTFVSHEGQIFNKISGDGQLPEYPFVNSKEDIELLSTPGRVISWQWRSWQYEGKTYFSPEFSASSELALNLLGIKLTQQVIATPRATSSTANKADSTTTATTSSDAADTAAQHVDDKAADIFGE